MSFRNKYITLKLFIILVSLTGVMYPLLMSLIGQSLFNYQANGSLYQNKDSIIGSYLIGQNFKSDKYFHPRPSYAGNGYEANNSSSSSFALTNKKFKEIVKTKYNKLIKNGKYLDIASDEVFASASGLDPYISLNNAYNQLDRIAKIRGIRHSKLQEIINNHKEVTFFGIIGNPRINVLVLNIYLDNYISFKDKNKSEQ
ncbi:MAG: potassium-transporting ATPase subunit KdpC [Alphaproteobacteria bacterium]